MNLCTEAIEIVLYDFSLNEELFQRMTKDMRRGIKTNIMQVDPPFCVMMSFIMIIPSQQVFGCLVFYLGGTEYSSGCRTPPNNSGIVVLFRAVKWAMTHIVGDVCVHPGTDKGQ